MIEAEPSKLDAVHRYLTRSFPTLRVERPSPGPPETPCDRRFSTFTFRLHDTDGTARYLLSVSYGFLLKYVSDAIERQLTQWDVVGKIQASGGKRVLVTTGGVDLVGD